MIKRRLLSVAVCLIMVLTVMTPQLTDKSYAAGFTVRTSLPSYTSSIGKQYYYTNDNIFYRCNYGPNLKYLASRGGYVRGNCTWYAYARASEIMGKILDPRLCRSASMWYSINKTNKIYPYGTTPKVGAIACYSNHVAIVEKIVDGKVYVSESGWRIGAKPTTASSIYFHYGTPWYSKAVGYIYILDGADSSTSSSYETTAVNYQVKITSKTLNMRTGPGTAYSSAGYITPGTYTVSRESNGWGYLNNGYWVSLSYTTKVENSSSSSSSSSSSTSSTTTVNYKVKITAKDLNMRTGPGSSYTSKGYVTPGTYTITSESNGWGKLSTNGYWVKLSYTTRVTESTSSSSSSAASSSTAAISSKMSVKVTASGVNMRTGAGTKYKSKGKVTKGKTYSIKAIKNGWGQLSSNGYWICLKYASLSGTAKVSVSASDLNMRTGAGVIYKSKGHIKKGTYAIKSIKNGWAQLSTNGYWVSLNYLKLV